MTKIIQQLVEELETLPEEEKKMRAASYLEDLREREKKKEGKVAPYASFKVLREAELPGPEDASATYEEKLYGSIDQDAK